MVCADLKSEPRPEGVEQDSIPTHEVINRVYGSGRAVFVRMDVNNAVEVQQAVKTAVSNGGRLDV